MYETIETMVNDYNQYFPLSINSINGRDEMYRLWWERYRSTVPYPTINAPWPNIDNINDITPENIQQLIEYLKEFYKKIVYPIYEAVGYNTWKTPEEII